MTAITPHAQPLSSSIVSKAPALHPGDKVGVFAPASPAEENRVRLGLNELRSLGFTPVDDFSRASQAYFSAATGLRLRDFISLLENPEIAALFALRGGYGSNYMLEDLWKRTASQAKCIVGYSDVTSLQILLWQKFHAVAFYGPMVAAGLDAGASAPKGYDRPSLETALSGAATSWRVNLGGEPIATGIAEGRILGGCLTLVETSLGTPWELDTTDSILLLEDRGMKPWQVDRALIHLSQAGKLRGVKG